MENADEESRDASDTFRINIVTLTGSQYELEVQGSQTVMSVQHTLSGLIGEQAGRITLLLPPQGDLGEEKEEQNGGGDGETKDEGDDPRALRSSALLRELRPRLSDGDTLLAILGQSTPWSNLDEREIRGPPPRSFVLQF